MTGQQLLDRNFELHSWDDEEESHYEYIKGGVAVNIEVTSDFKVRLWLKGHFRNIENATIEDIDHLIRILKI